MSKQVSNTTHILAHVFNSASRQCCEVWASQFPYLHRLKDMLPPTEVSLYGCINLSLAQVQQQSPMGLSQSFAPMRVVKARSKTGFNFNVQKRPVPESGRVYLVKRPPLESRTDDHQISRKSTGGSVYASSTDSRKKGAIRDGIPDVLQFTNSSSSYSVVQFGTLS